MEVNFPIDGLITFCDRVQHLQDAFMCTCICSNVSHYKRSSITHSLCAINVLRCHTVRLVEVCLHMFKRFTQQTFFDVTLCKATRMFLTGYIITCFSQALIFKAIYLFITKSTVQEGKFPYRRLDHILQQDATCSRVETRCLHLCKGCIISCLAAH